MKEKLNSTQEIVSVQKAAPTINSLRSLQTEMIPKIEGSAANINH